MNRFIVGTIIACTLLWPFSFSRAGEGKGTTAGTFLKLGVNARAAGLGDAYTAVADDGSAIYWNPAAMTKVKKPSFTLTHSPYIESSFYDFGGYVHPFPASNQAFGASVQYLSAGDIKKTDTSGVESGSFSPNDLAIALGYARKFPGVSIGFSGKFINSKIVDSASSQALDAGLLSEPYLNGKLQFGLSMSNLGGKLKYEQTEEDLPVTYRVGSSLTLFERWLISGDLSSSKGSDVQYALGTEYLTSVSKEFKLIGRIGFNSHVASNVEDGTGIMAGLGFKWSQMGLDYAFSPYGELGTTHRISLNFSLGGDDDRPQRIRHENDEKGGFRWRNMAVVDLDSRNVSTVESAVVADYLRQEFVRSGKFSVVDRKNMELILKEQKFQQTGCTAEMCAVKIGKILNVKMIVVGSLSKVNNKHFVINLNCIDVETAEILVAESITVSSQSEFETSARSISNTVIKQLIR